MIWFTSDTHFGHENILGFGDRPWDTIVSMNNEIIDNINYWVAPDDTLYHLGDYSFKITPKEAADLRSRINCKDIHLIPGNHDQDWSQPAVSWAFKVEEPICVLEIEKLKIILSHYPMADWQEISHGSIHLHGHIHSKGMKYNEINRMQGLYRYDVGVDANDYRPLCLDEILAWFKDIPCNGRADWRNWVNATGSKAVTRKLAGAK